MFVFSISKEIANWSFATMTVLQLIVVTGVVLSMHFALSHVFVVAWFALLVLSTSSDSGMLAVFLRARMLVFLGTLSYSIYLDHWIVYRAYWLYGNDVFSGIASNYDPFKVTILKFIVLFALILAASLFTFNFVELPARKYINTRLGALFKTRS